MFRNRTTPVQFLSMQSAAVEPQRVSRTTAPSLSLSTTTPRNDAKQAEQLPVAHDPVRPGPAVVGKKPQKGDDSSAKGKAPDPAGEPAGNAEKPTETAKNEESAPGNGSVEAAPVELEEKPAVAEEGLNRAAANAALASAAAAARGCRSRGDAPTGSGRAAVTFAADGSVAAVSLSQQFTGTAIGNCVAAQFRQARAPAFSGDSVTLFYAFDIPQ
jgi:hypothetical protein